MAEREPTPIKWLTSTESVTLFDKISREQMGISGEEFLRRWDAGELDDAYQNEHTKVMRVAMLIPFGRPGDD
jgi:hypothetical protein